MLIFRGALCHRTTFCPTVLFKGVTTVLRGRVLRIATSKRCHEIDTRGHRTEGEEPPHGQVTETAGDTGTHYTDSFLTDDSKAIRMPENFSSNFEFFLEFLIFLGVLGKF